MVMAAGRHKVRTEIHRLHGFFKTAAPVCYSRARLRLDVISKCPVGPTHQKAPWAAAQASSDSGGSLLGISMRSQLDLATVYPPSRANNANSANAPPFQF
jgi:hypothetical protein